MPLKSIYLVPHGGVIVPGMEDNRNEQAEHLHQVMEKVGKEIKEDKIQVVFLTSPHGYSHPMDYLIYYHNVFEGWQIFNNNNNQQVKQYLWPGNIQISQLFYQALFEENIPANPLILGDTNYPLKLAWGETIPLSYIGSVEGPQVVIFSPPFGLNMPEMQPDLDIDSISQLKKVGKVIHKISYSELFKDISVSVVISGDLSHKHDPDHRYGFHEDSILFDELAQKWSTTLDQEKLNELHKLNSTAESCGFNGMAIIQGIIESNQQNSWKNRYSVYECPTYFGMIVSSWKK